MLLEHDRLDARFHFQESLAGILPALLTSAFVRALVPRGEGHSRTKWNVHVNNAVHIRMVLEDDPLALATHRWFGSVGHNPIVFLKVDAKETRAFQFIEIGLAP